MKSPFIYLSIAGIAVLLTLALLRVVVPPYQYQGSVIDPPIPAADFTLTGTDGVPTTLSDQRGKLLMVYFGFTNCPDECPLTMANFARLREGLGKDADSVRFMMITVDPERDTREQLRSYLDKFDPSILGLTGTPDELAPVWKDYGVYVSVPEHHHDESYDVEHTSRVYLIDSRGNWRLTYTIDTDWQVMAADLQYMLAEE
jgi:protein SCO1/2